MNWVTVVIVLFIALLAWQSYRNGVIRELVALCALILAIPIAGLLYDDLAGKLDPIIDSSIAARLIAFLALLFGVVILGQVVASMLRGTARVLNLGWADQWAGGLFGLAKGVLIVQVVLIALVAFPKPDLRDDLDDSAVASGLLDAAPAALGLLPARFDDALDAFQDGLNAVDGESAGG